MSAMLVNVLPAGARRIAYSAYALVGLGLGSVPVYCAATSADTPAPILGALAVYAFVGGPLFGATAASNVSVNPHPVELDSSPEGE